MSALPDLDARQAPGDPASPSSPAALVPRRPHGGVTVSTSSMSPRDLGELLATSGFFQDSTDAAQAAVKVMAGAELGFGPVASMTGIFIVKGRVTLGAQIMAAAIKSHPLYDYRIKEHTDERCVIQFFESGESLGTSEFTLQDAERAGIVRHDSSWKTYPRNMLFARALSNGAKWYTPDAFGGGPVYVPEEVEGVEQLAGEFEQGRTAELERQVATLREQLAAALHEREALLTEAGQKELVAALEARWPQYDAMKFLVKLEQRYHGAVPQAAGDGVRAWAWYVGTPTAHRPAGPQEAAEPPPASA
jgi:hypothetical protein